MNAFLIMYAKLRFNFCMLLSILESEPNRMFLFSVNPFEVLATNAIR